MGLTIYSVKLAALQAFWASNDSALVQQVLTNSKDAAARLNAQLLEDETNAPTFEEALAEISAGNLTRQTEDSAPVYLQVAEAICKQLGEQFTTTNLSVLPAELVAELDDLLRLQGVPENALLHKLTTTFHPPLALPAPLQLPLVNYLDTAQVQSIFDTLEPVYDDEYDGQIVIAFNEYYEAFSVAAEQKNGLVFFTN